MKRVKALVMACVLAVGMTAAAQNAELAGRSTVAVNGGMRFSHPQVQNATQNFVHKYFANTPQFKDYRFFKSGGYSYVGTINPYTLWMY